MTEAATRKTRRIAKRSAVMILSISPACVERRSAPSTALKRWIGTATETIDLAPLVGAHQRRRRRR